ncbi:hypothetical protein OHC33_002775 [Knufia fluminis]|uniref:Uncharacterized protein n=1 Tax=Knufia fluminis TaxID=191047 RepID=A0AAN8FD91_9EURO|nr:hypothetical protein OHC33_002775 [Knufia fluminis]
MSPARTKDELRIFTPVGQLGQGWSEQIFWDTLDSGVDAIILDGGSTDSGPGRLALGKPNVPRSRLARDIGMLVQACHTHNVPALIGSAGGDGENALVDMCIDIVQEAVKANDYRPMKVISIYSEIPDDLVRQKLKTDLITPCGTAVPQLTEHEITTSTRIVAQMGLEPFLKAMQDNPGFDIIVGGRAFDPSPYAAFCLYHGFEDMGVNYAMGKIMECGGVCALPKSRESLAIVRHDNFDILPCDIKARCTEVSVAAHFLYEKTRPDIIHGPGGALLLSDTTYEQIDERTVRVRGAKYKPEPEGQYTVKLEGARVNGYNTIVLGAMRDPILLSQLDSWIASIEVMVAERCSGIDFELKIHKYGVNGVMGPLEPDTTTVPKEVFVAVQAKAATQDEANEIASAAKLGLTHMPYPDQLATAGNFAWPFTPSEVPMGPLAKFCVYHIMHEVDPTALFPIKVMDFHGNNSFVAQPRPVKTIQPQTVTDSAGKGLANPKKYYLTPKPAEGTCYLADIASVVRSKNSGPYELTFDILFGDQATYKKVKETGILTRETIAKLYHIADEDVIASLFWDQAMAYKATIRRPAVSGGFGETDTHGSQQHVPLLYIKMPFGRERAS